VSINLASRPFSGGAGNAAVIYKYTVAKGVDMDIKFNYETYQDVRRNLFFYSIPVLVVAGICAFLFVLPPTLQQTISDQLESLTNSTIGKGILKFGSGVVVFALIAFLMTEILQVHDRWYDRHFVKWRYEYAVDFILPRLIQPFASQTNYRFYEEAALHVKEFQERLYYPFVGDRDLKIPKNKLLRFYEVVTIYWLTQINEIVILFLAILLIVCRFVGPADLSYRTLLLNDCFALTLL
jgi:hypothetical protein